MTKVTGLELVEVLVAVEDSKRNFIKNTKKERIARYVAAGIDKTLARVMVESEMSCGI